MSKGVDVVLVNPGSLKAVYQDLGRDLSAIEPPSLAGLFATYLRRKGLSVEIVDAPALDLDPAAVAKQVHELKPVLVVMVVYGFQPSASTQNMPAAGETCRALKELDPGIRILLTGTHAAALPERTLREVYALAFEAETPDGRWGGALAYLDASQHAQRDRSPFALFGANYRDNPPAVEGDLHSLSAQFQVDTRDIQSPLLPSPGWWLRADAELAGGVLGGELDFRRAAIELNRFSRFGEDVWWNTRAVWMGPLDGDSLPVQRHVMLGGPGSLRGFRGGSFVDSQGGQISSEVRLPLPVGRRIALLFLSWHWVAFADAGALGDYEEWHANVGTGISGVNLLSFVELFVAQRITDLDEDGSGPRFVVRFRRDL